MAEPESPGKPVKTFLDYVALSLILESGAALWRGESTERVVAGLVGAGAVLVAHYKWDWLTDKLGQRFVATAQDVATDFRWWLVPLLLLSLYIGIPMLVASRQPKRAIVLMSTNREFETQQKRLMELTHKLDQTHGEQSDCHNRLVSAVNKIEGEFDRFAGISDEIVEDQDALASWANPNDEHVPAYKQRLEDAQNLQRTLPKQIRASLESLRGACIASQRESIR
jgi:hypothetical protein